MHGSGLRLPQATGDEEEKWHNGGIPLKRHTSSFIQDFYTPLRGNTQGLAAVAAVASGMARSRRKGPQAANTSGPSRLVAADEQEEFA
jgi:hypothetical protein